MACHREMAGSSPSALPGPQNGDPWSGSLEIGSGPLGIGLTDHAIDRAEEHRALGGSGRLAQVLHDQGTVAEDIDKLAQVKEANFLQVLPFLIGGGGTTRQ